MTSILVWLTQYALAIYLVCLVGAIAYGSAALAARRRLSAAQFSLEREMGQQQVTRAWLMTALFLALGGIVFLASAFVTPSLPTPNAGTPVSGVGLTPMPTATPTASPTVTPTVAITLTATAPITGDVAATPEGPTPTPTPTPEATPLPPDAYQPDCPSPNAQVVGPVAGATIWGQIEVRGTAAINSFAYYKFEVVFPGSDAPNFVAQYDTPIESGVLGIWDVSDPGLYPPGGPYRFRLVVVDIYGNTATCIVPLNIGDQSQP